MTQTLNQSLSDFMLKHDLSGASIARSIQVSTATVSQVKNGKTERISKEVMQKFNDFMQNFHVKATPAYCDRIVKTEDFNMVLDTINDTANYGGIGLVYGNPGTGKTTATKHYVDVHPEAVLVETLPFTTLKNLLIQVLEGLGKKDVYGNVSTLFCDIVLHFKQSKQILIIDEAENLTSKTLNSVRRIQEFSGVPIVLVGTHVLLRNLEGRGGELAQLYSRITERWEMQGLNKKDRKALFGDMNEAINDFTQDLRRSVNIYHKAQRNCKLKGQPMTEKDIATASTSVILD